MTPRPETPMKSRLQRFREARCRWFGHDFDDVKTIIFMIRTNERNQDYSATLTCKRCKEVFEHKNTPHP
jgi:hypothetical protein